MCFKTGQFYLLLTQKIYAVDNGPDVYKMASENGGAVKRDARVFVDGT